MPQFEFERKVTIGNLLSIATVVGGGLIAWQALAGDVAANTREAAALDRRVTAIESSMLALQREINNERITQTRILAELATDLRYLRAAVDDMRETTR